MGETRLGPILYARQATDGDWRFAIGLYIGQLAPGELDEIKVVVDGQPVPSTQRTLLADFRYLGGPAGGMYVRWEVSVERGAATRSISYSIQGAGLHHEVDEVRIPGRAELPRLAFFSCNGVSSGKLWRNLKNPFALWEQLVGDAKGFDVLIGGGDQIYADSLWDTPYLAPYEQHLASGGDTAHNLELPAELSHQILAGYVGLYLERWGRAPMAKALARIPGLYTWDDHDIFDGWGSHGEELQNSKIYLTVFEQAAKAFSCFQLAREQALPPPFLQTLTFSGGPLGKNTLDVVLPDTRSQRTERQVMASGQWKMLKDWLQAREGATANGGVRHLLFVAPIPVVYMRMRAGSESLGGLAGLRDDLIDQWESGRHRGERARLIMTLLEHQNLSNSAVTIVSGDVHLGARALIRSRNPLHVLPGHTEAQIEQITSSGIVHPPPSWLQYLGLRTLGNVGPDDLGCQVETELLPVGGEPFLLSRNWLSIDFDRADQRRDLGRMWLAWRTTDVEPPQTQVVVLPPPPAT